MYTVILNLLLYISVERRYKVDQTLYPYDADVNLLWVTIYPYHKHNKND